MGLNLSEVIQGDKLAFSKLFKEHYNTMYRISYSILKNDDDIQDALQEAAIKAYKGIKKLKDVALFKPWLIKITINESYNILKKKKNYVPIDTLEEFAAAVEEDSSNLDVKTAILNLEDDLRLVTMLYYYEDLPVKTIAKLLHIPEGTVKSRLSRARSKLYNDLNMNENTNQ